MQSCSKEMQGLASMMTLQELQSESQQQQHQIQNPQMQVQPSSHFDHAQSHDDFLDQMLSSYPSWSENQKQQLFNISLVPQGTHSDDPPQQSDNLHHNLPYDESTLLASRLRQHQISGNSPNAGGKPLVLPQQLLMARAGMTRSPSPVAAGGGGELGLLPLPLSLGNGDTSDSRLDVEASFRSHNAGGEGTVPGLYDGFTGSLPRTAQTPSQQQHFQSPQTGSIGSQNFGAPAGGGINQAPAAGTGAGAGGTAAPRQRVRARRGQATDPHSIAERLRRERIAERMKALQELVPNANKTDKASMLDEIIDYVKFLQLQVKVLSMSRLGGASAVAPLVADISSSEAASGMGRSSTNVGNQASSTNDSLTVTEHAVAKLMEEDMGSAMQYLQGKGLCLMPISLASAISSATRGSNRLAPGDSPSSPSMSVLTVQSAINANGGADASVKDAASVSKP